MTNSPENPHVERGAAEDGTDTPLTPTEEAVSEPPQQRWPHPADDDAPPSSGPEPQR